jgi:hypothetical protein
MPTKKSRKYDFLRAAASKGGKARWLNRTQEEKSAHGLMMVSKRRDRRNDAVDNTDSPA